MPRSCGVAECKKQPYWGVAGETPKFCFLHKAADHIDVRNKRCEVQTCEIRPHYGYDGEAPRFCAQHKAEGMHNLRSRRCQSENCPKYASCGPPGGAPELCATHKENGMVSLIGRRCSMIGCDTYASYGVVGTRPRYCARHREEDMVNLTVKKCETDGCLMQPNFNFEGQRKARFCHKHALGGMIDVLDRRCAENGCDRQPIYGNSGELSGRPTWCPGHRPDSSHDVKTARCQELGCLKHPSYGYDHDRIRRRCRLHKLNDMLDVKSPRCEMLGCKKQPCCGHLGAKARFCSEHKQDGMVNLKTRAFRCKHRGPEPGEKAAGVNSGSPGALRRKYAPCNRACRYAFPNEPAKFCVKHAENGMVDVLNPQCGMEDCLELPTHGYDGEQPTFCLRHMAEGMKVIVPQKANVLHWSSVARKKAEATAREASRIVSERFAGSAKVTPLPPKKDPEGQQKFKRAHADTSRPIVSKTPASPSCGSARVTPMVPGEDPENHDITADDVALAFGSQEPVEIGESPPRSGDNSAFAANAIASAALSAAVSAATSAAAAAAVAAAAEGREGVDGDPWAALSGAPPPAYSEIASAIDVGVRAGMEMMGMIDPAKGAAVGEIMGYGRLPLLPAPLPIPLTNAPALAPTPASALLEPALVMLQTDGVPPPCPNETVEAISSISGPGTAEQPPAETPIEMSVLSLPGAYGGPSVAAPEVTVVSVSENGSTVQPALTALTTPSVAPVAPDGASSTTDGVPAPWPSGVNSTTASSVEPLCASRGCAVLAKFGHPKHGKGATRCLVHCEAGMHRLAPDAEQWPITSTSPARAEIPAIGAKRTRSASAATIATAAAAAAEAAAAEAADVAAEEEAAAGALEEVAAGTEEEATDGSPIGGTSENAERHRKRMMVTRSTTINTNTTRAKEGMMLLAGAVTASRSKQPAGTKG